MLKICQSLGGIAVLVMGLNLIASAQSPPASNFNQGFDRYAPKSIDRQDAPQPDKPGGEIPDATGDESIITDKLVGLVFYSNKDQVEADGIQDPQTFKGADHIKFVGFTPPDVKGFQEIVNQRIGQPASMLSLNQMLRDLLLYYRKNNLPVVDIYIPEQAMVNSIVQIVVTESTIGEIRAEGNKHFSSSLLVGEVSARPGETIRSDTMARDISWLNNNPFRRVDLVYAQGQEAGTTDVVLKTADRFPLRSYVSVDDSGGKLTQDDRYSAGFTYGNLFGADQEFSYQYIGSPDFNALRAHSASYVIPLPWRHTLTFFGSYGDSVANFNTSPALSSTGASWQISMRYNISLEEIPMDDKNTFKHEVLFGYDYKESNSQLLNNGQQTNNNFTQVSQFMAGYNATIPDNWGGTTFTSSLFFSPGGMLNANNNTDFALAGNGATSSYVYGRWTLDRTTKLPADFTWALKGLYQLSDARLLGSEQLGLGGYATVRGYDEREVNGDDGFLLSNEIRTPSVSLGNLFGISKPDDHLQFLAFVDYGQVDVYGAHSTSLPAVQSPGTAETLASVGPGLRYNVADYLTVRFDYGWQLENSGESYPLRHGGDSRGHFAITFSY